MISRAARFLDAIKNNKERKKDMAATYNITGKHCATCRYWNGERGIEFCGNRPYRVKVGNTTSTCMAKSNTRASAGTVCSRWAQWEKI